jgi:glutaminyl-tRNA synthetase
MASEAPEAPTDFIRDIVAADQAADKWGGRVTTRFPPEPSGYLHIGHVKATSINFGVAEDFGGVCHLRFDDTNPSREAEEFVIAQQEDLRWLGFDWGDHLYYASDYFETFYEHAQTLIRNDKAFVCDLSAAEIREYRGTLTEPGRPSPYRERSVDENLDLLARMRAGEFEDGIRTLRGKIDMAAPNLTLRDPVFYRIQKITHQRTGDAWSIYPMYDFAHCISDSIEKITHSLCSIEFDNNRPLYDWILDTLELDPHPQQIEFARLNLTYTVTGKRKLRQLVEEGHVRGWDDPRMPTIRGLARRGYTARSLRTFAARIGVTRNASTSELALLEHCVREDLNAHSPRVMAVLDPLRLVIENYPEDQVEQFEAVNNPEDASAGTRQVPFSRELWIERDDFREEAPRKFFRLSPGREVRLRAAYLVTCTEVVKNDAGDVIEVRCRYDPETRGGDAPDGRKVKGTLHWVSASHALSAEVRLYETLFSDPAPDTADDFRECLNPDSLKLLPRVFVEPSLAGAAVGERYQFERLGYFCVDPDTKDGHLVFNRTVPLRDSWARLQKRGAQ